MFLYLSRVDDVDIGCIHTRFPLKVGHWDSALNPAAAPWLEPTTAYADEKPSEFITDRKNSEGYARTVCLSPGEAP